MKDKYLELLEEWIEENPHVEEHEWDYPEMMSFAKFCVEKETL